MIKESATPDSGNLLDTVFQQLRAESSDGVVVAITSATSREGVTHSVTALSNTLSKDQSKRILQVDASHLRDTTCAPASLFRNFRPVGVNIFNLACTQSSKSAVNVNHSWTGNWKYRRDCIQQLRSSFDFILVDCPAVQAAGDVFSLVPLVDGVIMVVEAGKTRAGQVRHAEQSIEFARGKLIGHILNKRNSNVPGWISKLL